MRECTIKNFSGVHHERTPEIAAYYERGALPWKLAVGQMQVDALKKQGKKVTLQKKEVGRPMSSRDQAVMNCFLDGKRKSADMVSRMTGLTMMQVRHTCYRLERVRKLKRTVLKGNVYFELAGGDNGCNA